MDDRERGKADIVTEKNVLISMDTANQITGCTYTTTRKTAESLSVIVLQSVIQGEANDS